jgi:hypothetical protein
MRPPRNSSLYALLIVVAAARLSMQMVAMPPYAGLDELFHVARLEFVAAEHRSPTTSERSIPPHLEATLHRNPAGVSSFAVWQKDWRDAPVVRDRALTPADMRPYARPNYEAQQPSVYYSLIAPLAALAPRSVLSELRVWRLASVLFALVTVIAIATIAEKWFGPIGIVAAVLIVFVPTWETLVLRASNDAFACAIVAVAIAATVRQKSVVEAIAWPLAIAIKLYTWPIAIVAPILWWRQRAPRWRPIAVTALALITAGLTLAEVSSRANNPFGVVAFDRPASPAEPGQLDVPLLIKVTIASAAWTSGEHFDALRPLAIALYVLPILIAIGMSIHNDEAILAAAALIAFGASQVANVIACLIAKSPQIGGKEGWYWFVLAPVLVPALLAPAIAGFRWVPWWIFAWDIVITDCELIPTWLGLTSPDHPSFLFRWGPLHLPPAWTVPFRIVQAAALVVMVRRA